MRWARLLSLAIAASSAVGCHLAPRARVPPLERAFATEGDGSSAAPERPAVDVPPADAARRPEAPRAPAAPPEDADDADDADEAPVTTPKNLPVASRYARLDRARCEAELDRRKIAFARVDEARGVLAPVRLRGPLSGVTFRSSLPPAQSRTSPYDIYDCRLVLALDDFARVLERYGIVEVVHLSVYRPPPAKRTGLGRRHGGGLAIDAAIFKTADGRALSVKKDFGRRAGKRPCPAPASASELRKLACEAGDAGLFNVVLTPYYNRAHRDHLHLEVSASSTWTFVR